MFIANDLAQFKNLFVSQLKNMLSDDELGAFILVLANSQQDNFLKAELNNDLEKIFSSLKDKAVNHQLKAPQDDIDVFDQLLSLELPDIHVWKNRVVGEWQITHNLMRKLRPARSSSQNFDSTRQPFDESKFHFNKAFLEPEILWRGEFKSHQLSVLYNKFPFSDYHLLIAVSPLENKPQLLTQEMHDLNCALVEEVAGIFPGFGIGFNSLAAGASVNHLHCQAFIRSSFFPIENKYWSHNGGDKQYPLQLECFPENKGSWEYLEELLQQDIAFNCLYREKSCYVIPRKYQGSVEVPEWLSGAGWLDVAGVITVSDERTFDEIDAVSVSDALSLLA